MVMDANIRSYYRATSGSKAHLETVSVLSDPNLINTRWNVNDSFVDRNSGDLNPSSSYGDIINPITNFAPLSEIDVHDDYDFSDVVLRYINDMLMEEDMEDKNCMFQESSALQAAEKSLYDVLMEKYTPSSPHHHQVPNIDINLESLDEKYIADNECVCPTWNYESTSTTSTITYSHVDSSKTSESILQFNKGVEEANKFLPNGNNLVKSESEVYKTIGRGTKNPHNDYVDLEQGRNNKQCAVYSESNVTSETFDMVLLCSGGKNENALRESWQNGENVNTNSKGRKSRGKRQGNKKSVVDLRSLLTLCAQAVASDDRRTANDFLNQIRQHSSPVGDGMQRLAHYFAHGLEARMAGAGAGTQIHKVISTMPASASDILKAYQLYLAICPFRKVSNFFSNKTIMNVCENATRVHIIDFGILYGFQWPCLIQRLSSRPGGPPKLRITGVDLPCPGFKPSERVEETGRRLAKYAETFHVPFEFHAIAQKWETIKIEDLKIDKDELLVVNSLYRMRNILDETVVVNSPRNMVLQLIKKMNPCVFIQGIVNGAYNAPFFITRFREALFHFSSLFDMLEANVPREIHERLLLEGMVFGREAMNVIACEAAERIERPETYKQWQVRNLRAGFEKLPLNDEILKIAKDRAKSSYHKDFVIDEDGQWLLQGWKGRIIYALSSWKPVN